MSAREWFDVPYESRFNPALPWGYWLIAPGELDDNSLFIDHNGDQWESVREYFWEARLGMSPITLDNERNEELEFLLANLAIRDTRSVPIEESALDLFGSWDRARHYSCWLNGQRLVASGREAHPNSLLSPEGHAVLLMLASTRKPNLAPLPIGLPTLESFHGLADNPTEDERERLIAEQEKAARHLRYQFTRQDLGGQPAIVMSGIGLGPNIPLTRVLWSMTFMDSYARDRTLFWMHERIDRWLDWGELAYRKGARAFTEHLLQLAFADKLIDTAS